MQSHGWWPTLAELTLYLRADRAATYWYVAQSQKLGLLEREKRKRADVRVTPRGWAALAYAPLLPWRRRPSASIRDTITAQVVKEVLAELKA